YAGHGIEVDGTNYLIPVDAKLERDSDVYDEAFSLDRVLLAIEPARQLRLVILDACRDNPFAKTMKRTLASRAIGQGLAKIEPNSPNMLIAYSAKAGSTALDGDKNSPFTAALVRHIATPGLDVRKALGFVRDDVLKNTSYKQEPYVYGSLGGDDVPLVPAKPAPSVSGPSTPVSGAQAEARQDYELAMQVGNKEAFNAFLVQHPDGFYASLAKIQIDKIAAEEARVAATEKARLAEQEHARLVAEGAQKAQQLKAEADAKAAEQARIAAEKAKQVAQEQAAEAERKRAATEAPAAGTPAETKVADTTVTAGPSAPAKGRETKQETTQETKPDTSVASLDAGPSQPDIAKQVQIELRRVGCLTGAADGDWNAASQRSLAQFNRRAGTKLDVKLASRDALDAIKLKPSRVCPLICEHGFEADGDHCNKIVCAEGSFLNDDNECEKRREKKPIAKRDRDEHQERPERPERPERAVQERPGPGAGAAAKPQASGQIVCDTGGCRPVQRGCHLEYRTFSQGGPYEGQGGNVQICK
ncbi:MAG: caspase family protein, partial [Bradyrhizobium sp.]|uniref:caspase family protein n=1 Tax=Bradyrhizobium sp. TaxID=376 RepID=UPI00121EAE3C